MLNTSILYWIPFHFFRYAFLKGEIPVLQFVLSGILGILIIIIIGSFFLFKRGFGATTQNVGHA